MVVEKEDFRYINVTVKLLIEEMKEIIEKDEIEMIK